MSVTIIRTIELIDEEEKEVEFNCDYIIANTGIGSYEWWEAESLMPDTTTPLWKR